MKKLDESAVLWLKKWAGLLTEADQGMRRNWYKGVMNSKVSFSNVTKGSPEGITTNFLFEGKPLSFRGNMELFRNDERSEEFHFYIAFNDYDRNNFLGELEGAAYMKGAEIADIKFSKVTSKVPEFLPHDDLSDAVNLIVRSAITDTKISSLLSQADARRRDYGYDEDDLPDPFEDDRMDWDEQDRRSAQEDRIEQHRREW